MDDTRLKRLPKWAQDEIVMLTNNLRAARDQLAAICGSSESNVVLPHYLPNMEDQNLPMNQQVQFLMPHPKRTKHIGYVIVRHGDRGGLYINGTTPVSIDPESSNALTVRLRDFKEG